MLLSNLIETPLLCSSHTALRRLASQQRFQSFGTETNNSTTQTIYTWSSSDVRVWPRAVASVWNFLKNSSVVGVRTRKTPAKSMSTATVHQLCGWTESRHVPILKYFRFENARFVY
ncbi:hypothetical protein AVEN_72032-1 [Araneus ventricosus]|uniref:Uncharacterized protein n=1 Tax=Araneus ventricosus TaxID=182803 RepID=A0A4Y2ECH0_ARAVE|nr:hypothetical protein AVEN_240912-1 [Araneus ventricosus]GBM26863.1 hypothetical protein AVEN_72032-1 [Araneus ventricosus]